MNLLERRLTAALKAYGNAHLVEKDRIKADKILSDLEKGAKKDERSIS